VTTPRLWAFLGVALPVLGAVLANLQTVDLAYHLRAGGMILDTVAIPRADSFTFTAAGIPWQDQQWGAEVLLAAVYRLAGWSGLVVLRAALVAAIFGLVYDICCRGHTSRTAALMTLAAFGLAVVTLALRPQLFGMVLFATTLWLVVRRRDHPRGLWFAVPIAAVWASIHGSFFLGPVILALAAVEDLVERSSAEARRTLIIGVAAAAATVLNPFGTTVWQYVVGISTNAVITTRITEWQPTSIGTPEGFAFFVSVALIAGLLVVQARRGHSVRAGALPLLWLVPFASIGVWAVRGLAWWPLVAAATVSRFTTAPPGAAPPRQRTDTLTIRRVNAVVVGGLVLAVFALLPVWRSMEPGLGAPVGVVGTAPPGITAALRNLVMPGDRLFAPQPWGSWFEFALPETLVFIDSRIELFPTAVWDDYDAIIDGHIDWQARLDHWEVSVVVGVAGGPTPLPDRLVADPGWHQVYADDDGRIFVRSNREAVVSRQIPGPTGCRRVDPDGVRRT
jgi:hypothetical protein